jgi:hypothetical protein
VSVAAPSAPPTCIAALLSAAAAPARSSGTEASTISVTGVITAMLPTPISTSPASTTAYGVAASSCDSTPAPRATRPSPPRITGRGPRVATSDPTDGDASAAAITSGTIRSSAGTGASPCTFWKK